MTRFVQYITIILLCYLFSCAHQPQLKESDVTAMSRDAAIKAGYQLEEYGEPKAHFEFLKKDRKLWTVFFGSKGTSLDHFIVLINEKTGEIKVFPGE